MSSTIVVTGGSGFIGTRLVRRLLAAGHEVRIVDKNAAGPYAHLCTVCDIRDTAGLQRACAGAQVIYHLAAEHRDDVRPIQLYEEVNVQGSRNVRAAAEALGIDRILFTSSVAVYGFAAHELNETAEPRPFNEYGRTKLEAEKVFREWAEQGSDRSLVIVRPAAVFGEGNRANVYNFLRRIAKKSFWMVGRGNNKKSIAYVENAAAFLEFALRFGTGAHLYNYADKPDLEMNNLVRLVKSKLGQPTEIRVRLPYFLGYGMGSAFDGLAFLTRRRFPISAVRVRKFCENSQFSAAKALATEFRPPVTLDEGLDRVLQAEFGRGVAADHTQTPAAAQAAGKALVKQA
ncbi:MAG: NAD-dependent epimerase/dehydratase family protein [Gemmataceae bacterium]